MHVIWAYVQLREVLALHRDLATKLDELERKVGVHDQEIQAVFDAVRRIMTKPGKTHRVHGGRKTGRVLNWKRMNHSAMMKPDAKEEV